MPIDVANPALGGTFVGDDRTAPNARVVGWYDVEWVDVDGFRVGFERVGTGSPGVVLLHGYVGDGPATWRNQLDALADSYTVVAWDAPGTGSSVDPPESLGMAGFADCLAGFIAVLGLDRPHVVGLSFGGALAMTLCARHPGIARSLVVVSGYAGWAGSLPPDLAEQRLAQALRLSRATPTEFVHTLLPTMFVTDPDPASIEQFAASMREFHPAGFRAMARALAEDMRDVLPQIGVPTLLIAGDQDVRAPLSVAEHLHTSISDSTLVVLPDVGHICNLEASQRFNDTVRSWLSERT
jgi:pimeloyl-ACP methyl ester carboxylesterase